MASPKDSNYSTESRVPQILVGTLVPFTVASVTVLARFFTRAFITRSWGTDDSWILVSWCFEILLTMLTCILTRYGVGDHQSAISIHDYQSALLLGYFVRLVYQLVLGTTKIAICALFLRIFSSDRKDVYAMYSLLAFIVCYTIVFILTSTFQCHPISDAWRNEDSSRCSNYRATLWATGICNILVDVLLLAFVVPRILTLKIQRRQKTGLLAIVSLSVLAIIAAIVRVARVTEFNSSSDEAWNGSDITTWSAVESCTGLFCACAAPLKPLYRILFGRSSSTGARSSISNYLYTRRAHHIYAVEHHKDELNGKHSLVVNTIGGLGLDTESTAELVHPIPAAQSWAMASIKKRVGDPV